MKSLTCPDCGTAVPWKAAGCAGCGVPFREIRCVACKYVGAPDRFANHACPRCSKDSLQIVPTVGEEIEEVGNEAFVEDSSTADEIERSFGQERQKKSHSPAARGPGPKPSKPAPAKPSPPQEKAATPLRRSSEDTEPKYETPPTPRRPQQRSTDKYPETPKAPARHEPYDERRRERKDHEPPPVLKRRSWSKSDDESDEDDAKPSSAAKPARSTKQELVTDRKAKRLSLDLSPKVQQLMRWAPLSLPVLLILFFVFYLFGGSGGRPKIRHGTEMSVDNGALEAQAAAIYEAAKQAYKSGQSDQALMSLQQVATQFPQTQSGAQARAALERYAQGQPLFEGVAAVAAPEVTSALTEPPVPSTPQPPAEKKRVAIGIPTTPPPSQRPPTDFADENLIAGTPPKLPGAPPQGSTLAKSDAKPRQLPQGFEAVKSAGVHSTGWPIEIVCLRDKSHMMLVPAGDFEMGSNSGEANAQPTHPVKLKTFYIDKFEITMLQYKHFLEQRRLAKNSYRELSQAALSAAPTDRHPVVGVAWRDANVYAEWAGKSLPTEAEWECAARGNDGRLFPWGSGPPTWENPRESKQIDRVGSFTWDVSVYGCFDMAGNAWEWCADWYDPKFYHSSPTDNPEGPADAPTPTVFNDPEKVIRGGSAQWNTTWRGFSGIQEEPLYVGFRCVLEVERLAPRVTVATPSSTPPTPGRIPATAPRIPPGGYKF